MDAGEEKAPAIGVGLGTTKGDGDLMTELSDANH